jgi:hypothetical protein
VVIIFFREKYGGCGLRTNYFFFTQKKPATKPTTKRTAPNICPELWLTFIDSRNETSHAYDEDVAKKVFINIQKFIPEIQILITNLQKI